MVKLTDKKIKWAVKPVICLIRHLIWNTLKLRMMLFIRKMSSENTLGMFIAWSERGEG
jgi:hypothetical protein